MNVKKETQIVKSTDRSKKRHETWGDTTDGISESSKMVYVKNIPFLVSIDELKEFFKQCGKIVGVHLADYFAIIKFDRPLDASNAVAIDSSNFKGRLLKIRHWRDGRTRSERDKSVRSTHERRVCSKVRNEDRSRSRSATRLRSRSRSRSPSPYYRRHQVSIDSDRLPDQDQLNWASSRSNNQSQLPRQIAIILQFVLMDDSARNLSLAQVETLIDYFQHMKEFIWSVPDDTTEQNGGNEPEQKPEPEPGPEEVNELQQGDQSEENSEEPEDDEESADDMLLEVLQRATGRSF